MRDEKERAGVPVEGGLELLDGGEVEVVGGLVQHEEVDAQCGEGGQLRPGALAR